MMAVAIDILCTIVEIGLLFYIFKVYFGEEKCGKWLTFILYFVLGCVMFFVSHMELALAPKMVCTFLIMLCPMFLYDNNWLAKVLVGTTLWAVQLSCEFFTWGFLSLITQNLHEPLVGHEIDNYIQGVFLSKSIAILVVYWIAAFKKQNKYYGHKKLLCAFMLLPMITTISLNQLAYATAFIQTKITHERFLLVALFMIGANALLFYLFDKQMDAERLRREYELLTLREKLQEDYYASLIQRDIEVSKINHDMKNHISFLRYQLEHNDIEIAKNYL